MTLIINLVVKDKIEMITLTLVPCNREEGAVSGTTMIQMSNNLTITREEIKTLEGTIRMSNASHKEAIKHNSNVRTSGTKKKKMKVVI